MATTKVTLKLLIDKKANKVIFAEAGKDFVDFLFNLLSLPVGTVVRLLPKQSMVGCMGNLYESIENLNETYMQPNQKKDLLLKPSGPPPVANVPLLLPDNSEPTLTSKFYKCLNCHRYVSNNPNAKCPSCNQLMSHEMKYVNPVTANGASTSEGGYVKGLVTYMVMDDLSVMPISMISGIAVLNKCNVKEFDALEEKVVELGIDEGLQLLKASLQSKAALTYVFLAKKVEDDTLRI